MDKDIKKKPAISVVMSAYNASRDINLAIKSILNQTFEDFEFIIINDGSTDDTLQKINKFKDRRIKIISRANKGLVYSLNEGISIAKSEIIARQDADDISLPNRLEKEFEEIKNNVLIGSSMITIDEKNKYRNTHQILLNDPELKLELLIRSPFAHGSVLFKKSAFIKAGCYKQSEWPAEDYGLWLRMAPYGSFKNLDEPLYKYRENSFGISALFTEKQLQAKEYVQKKAWKACNSFIPKNIETKEYLNLEMADIRLERITKNTIESLIRSVAGLRIVSALLILRLLLTNRILFKKTIRLLIHRVK